MSNTIDVIVLTYNRAELFEKTLISVCNQTYKDFTIKVLNNGSTDNTEEVFYKVKKKYPHRKFDYMKLEENHRDQYFIDKKNEFITSDYIIVFHDDDLMHPRYIEHLMKIIPEHPEFVILGGKTRISEQPEDLAWDEPTGKFISGDMVDMVEWYFKGDTFSFPAICYKSYWYKNTKFREDLYGNRADFPFLMDIAEQGKVCRLEDRFLHYRKHISQDTIHFPALEKQKNLIKKMADVMLMGDKKRKDIFYNGIKSVFIPNGYINSQVAFEEGWLPWPEKNISSSRRINIIHLGKYILYGMLSSFSSKYREKAQKHLLKSKTYIKIDADPSNELRITKDTSLDITVRVKGKNNKVVICSTEGFGKLDIEIIGDNNAIFVEKIITKGKITINNYCSDGKINIRGVAVGKELTVCNGYKEHCDKIVGGKISIGKNINIGEIFIFNPHSDTYINIGDSCMLSSEISIRNTDGHPIYDVETKECLNQVQCGEGIDIGTHVWVGLGATILKNTKIPENSIIGTQSVVTKQFFEPNVVIAGNPAKVVKHNITWTAQNNDFFTHKGNTRK